jgi:hypothetical protein
MIPQLAASNALSVFAFGFLFAFGWTLGAWVMSRLLSLLG